VANSISATALPDYIQNLLAQRQQHTDSIAEIDATLSKVSAALGTAVAVPAKAPKPAAKAAVAAAPAAKPTKAKRAGRGKFAISATDLVLKFIGANKNPTTKEITQYLVSEGRSLGAVSNALSVLTKSKALKRTPLGKGIMGSRYSLA
jgi:hypothetical protein